MELFKVTGDRFQLNVPLVKYNEKTGEFEGWATIEELDAAGEIIDIEKSWPYFAAWSERFAKATDGESLGNVREQHDPKRAAGKLTAIDRLIHSTGAEGIYVKGVAVDPVSKEKLVKRVLTGLSIGGRYVEKNEETGRYVADPTEISIVDNPCVENAMITVVKANGSEEIAKAVGFTPSQFWSCRSGNEHGHVTKAEAKACDGTGVQKSAPVDVKKSLYTVSNLVSLLTTLLCITNDVEWEETWDAIEGEAADSEILKQLQEIAQRVFDALEAMLADERAELDEALASDGFELSVLAGHLKKSATAKQLIKSLRVPSGNGSKSTTVQEENMQTKKEEQAPAEVKPVEKAEESSLAKSIDGLAKAVSEMHADVKKDRERVDAVEKSIKTTEDAVKTLTKTILTIAGVSVGDDLDPEDVLKRVASKPAAPKAALRAVTKSEDSVADVPAAPKSGNPLVDGAKLLAAF